MKGENRWFVIINPTSGNGLAKRKWPKIEQLLKTNDFAFQHHFTKHEGHSPQLIQNAVNQGFKRIIVVGGDGTIHNVVNGIMQQNSVPSNSIHFGAIPIGTGNDWVKTYHIPRDIDSAIQVIKKGYVLQQDVGELRFENHPSKKIYFNNLAGIGYDGYVVHKVGKYKHFGAFAYMLGAVSGLFNAKNFEVEVEIDSQNLNCKALMVLVGLCQFSGGGMQLTKDSNPSDGLFDISIAKEFSALDILRNLPKLFNGKVTQHSKILTKKASEIKVMTKTNRNPFVQADGELIGVGGFSVRIIKNAISFYTP